MVVFILLTVFVYYYGINITNDVYTDDVVIQDNIDNNKLTVLVNSAFEPEQNEFERLREEYQNDDIKALLRIKGLNYQAVIPQADNNKFYLNHLINKSYGGMGTPFLDSRVDINSSRKLLIYGHNSSKYDMPFKILENYCDKNFYKKYPYIELETEKGIKTYQIFSVYVETKDFSYYNKLKFASDDDYYRHISVLKDKSFFDTGVKVNKNDDILILQTCSTLKKYKNLKKKYLLIVSKEVSL
jgi:SrtB family sortase